MTIATFASHQKTMRTVHLYGHLKKSFGSNFRLSVGTPGKAIRLLNANFPGFQKQLRDGYYRLVVGRRHGGDVIDLTHLEMGLGSKDFHIVPVIGGAKNGGVIKAVLGVALVGAAIFFSGGTLAAPLASMGTALPGLGGIGLTYGTMAGLGVTMALAGISQMISPTQKATTGTDKSDSYALSGPTNLEGQGYPVPLVIGEVIAGGIPISSGFDIEDIAVGS
ncbi:tail assembly protein [Methylobacterium sp. Leaf466]|uniref:tail assembly protein n=1 Tax=Methylobacterium sp. Leaf466 TaxID=1736386 RepID=UPI0006FC570C|nr:tail assembly protein [Methylobacterium sp. Leaf466]KQT77977.1 hypothetical protein ASG59_11780 [Methylobacterium sp. Leaf466]